MKSIFTLISFLFFSFLQAQDVSLTWAKSIGGGGSGNYVLGKSVAIDGSGNVYTTGHFGGTADFNPDPAATFNMTSGGQADAFVSKLDAAGNFVWAKQFKGDLSSGGNSIAVDGSGNVYTTGIFFNTVDFNPDPAATHILTALGENDIFISKLNAAGNFVWAIRLGSSAVMFENEEGFGITTDAAGNVYTTGTFIGTVDFNPDPAVTNDLTASGVDIFVLKLNSAGTYIWAKRLGGAGREESHSIAVDAGGNVYTTGYFQGTADFNPDPAVSNNLTSAGSNDVFVSKLDSSGNFVWAKGMGGSANDEGNSVVVGASGNILTTGIFEGLADFNPDPAVTNNLTSAGGRDIFISKLDASGNFVWAKSMGSTGNDVSNSIAVDAAGFVYTTGYFAGTADFNPDPAVTNNLTSAGSVDIFISKLDAAGNFVVARQMGGGGIDVGKGLVLDTARNIYITGDFRATADFDPDPAATFNLTSAGIADIFVVKLSQAATLPITLSGFTIQNNRCTANLMWTTATQQNSKHFEVQYSTDSVTFTTKDIVAAGGNSSAEKHYSYSSNLTNKNNYFRLRLVDQDGSVKFSPVVRVTGNCGGAVTVYPNPAKNRIYIQGAEKLKQIQLLDVQGRLIKNLQPLSNNIFNIQFLRPGTYWVKMIGDEVQTFKLIKE